MQIAGAISAAIVQATKEHSGRGPTRCRTYIDDDLVIVLMREGYSQLEDTLFEDGKWLDVRAMRHTFQDTMQARYSEIIERMTGRTVVAFMSASHHPDLQMQTFVLASGGGGRPDRPQGLAGATSLRPRTGQWWRSPLLSLHRCPNVLPQVHG